MKDIYQFSGFILLIIGTMGLLLNEFVVDWGRAATLLFAVCNVIGLIMLVMTYARVKNKQKKEE